MCGLPEAGRVELEVGKLFSGGEGLHHAHETPEDPTASFSMPQRGRSSTLRLESLGASKIQHGLGGEMVNPPSGTATSGNQPSCALQLPREPTIATPRQASLAESAKTRTTRRAAKHGMEFLQGVGAHSDRHSPLPTPGVGLPNPAYMLAVAGPNDGQGGCGLHFYGLLR